MWMERDPINLTEDKIPWQQFDFDLKVRNEVLRGCGLAKELEQQLRLTPRGILGKTSSIELRSRFVGKSIDILTSFINAIKLLHSSTYDSQIQRPTMANRTLRNPPEKKRTIESRSFDADSPSTKTRTTEAAPNLPHPPGVTERHSTLFSPSLSDSPISGNSDGSPTVMEGDADDSGARSKTDELVDNSSEVQDPDNSPEKLRKRKFMPKMTIRLSATNPVQANELPPDDGHTWRKYGQKDILGACYPRSYYRCTHKNSMGCHAIKQVQRCDEDPNTFEVTYRGHHSCSTAQPNDPLWPFPFRLPASQIGMQSLQASQCPSRSYLPPTLVVSSNGEIHFTPSPSIPQLQQSLVQHLSTSPPLPSGNINLILRPPGLPSPSQIAIPRFEMGGAGVQFELPSNLASSSNVCSILKNGCVPPPACSFLGILNAQQEPSKEISCSAMFDKIVDNNHNMLGPQKFECELSVLEEQTDILNVNPIKELVSLSCGEDQQDLRGFSLPFSDTWNLKSFSPTYAKQKLSGCMPHAFLSPATSKLVSTHPAEPRPLPGTTRRQMPESEGTEVISEHVLTSPFDMEILPNPFDEFLYMEG